MYVGLKGKQPLNIKLGLIPLIIIGSLLALSILYLVGARWWSSRPPAPTIAIYHDPYDWEMVMYKQGEVTGPRCKTKIVLASANKMALEYDYGRGIGRIRIQSADGRNWQGTWETSAADGILSLKLNPERDSLRGRWSDPDCDSEVDKKGGEIHLMKIR